MNEHPRRVSLREIAITFFIIGATGFGGGMAIVSLTERVCVRDKKWIGLDEFMHGLAFGQILGPFSLNTCTFVGYYLRGIPGGVAASAGFIAPSFIFVTILSWLYFRFHKLPQLQSALHGVSPVIIALILVATLGMARSQVKGWSGGLMALVAFAAFAFFDIGAVWILAAAALWSLAGCWYRREHA